MQILEGLLSEGEVLGMPIDTLRAYILVFDQLMYDQLNSYIEATTSNKQVVEKLQEAVGTEIVRNTFHTKVNESGVRSFVWNNRLTTLPDSVYSGELDVDDAISKLKWLSENSHRLSSTLPVRTKAMFESALEKIEEYEADKEATHDNQISAMMRMYKDRLFCPRVSKPVKTGMSGLMLGKSKWLMQLRALEYLKLCRDSSISMVIAREV